MRVLADYHHGSLFQSLQLLFEGRLGAELYRPIGMEWYEQGYWNVYPHPATASQFLTVTDDVSLKLNSEGVEVPGHEAAREDDGIFHIDSGPDGGSHRGITLDKFASLDFDIVISSIPQHIEPYNRLIAEHSPAANHVFQVGNSWGHQPGVGNILISAAPFSVPEDMNVCFYHQEFDLDVFSYEPPGLDKSIFSYIHWMRAPELFAEYADRLSESFSFRAFGAGMGDTLPGSKTIAAKMKSSTFTWHYKPEGDGFGHVIHNSYAVGRPALIWGSHYRGRLAEALFENDVTCIDMELGTPEDNVQRILEFSEPDRHAEMCAAAHQRFCEVVDFDESEQRVRAFLDRLR